MWRSPRTALWKKESLALHADTLMFEPRVRSIATEGIRGVGTIPTLILGSAARADAVINNVSDTAIYIARGTGALTVGGPILLAANGGNYEINSGNLYHGEVWGVCGTNNKTIGFSEGWP